MTINTTRRAILAGAAALPALSLPAIASPAQADPVLAKIKELHRLYAIWTASIHRDPGDSSPKYEAWNDETRKDCWAYNDAFNGLIAMKPTTREGAVAQIEFCLADDSGIFGSDGADGEGKEQRALFRTLAAAIPTLDEAVQS